MKDISIIDLSLGGELDKMHTEAMDEMIRQVEAMEDAGTLHTAMEALKGASKFKTYRQISLWAMFGMQIAIREAAMRRKTR